MSTNAPTPTNTQQFTFYLTYGDLQNKLVKIEEPRFHDFTFNRFSKQNNILIQIIIYE